MSELKTGAMLLKKVACSSCKEEEPWDVAEFSIPHANAIDGAIVRMLVGRYRVDSPPNPERSAQQH
jgi:hypothetical protein